MALRRFAGLLTSFVMLHLTFVASDVACATHMANGHAPMGTARIGDHGAAHSMDMSAGTARQQPREQHQRGQPCDTPVQPNCCQALASCSSMFTATAVRSAPTAVRSAGVPRSVIDIPVSELVAPDTPPPKA